MSEDKRYFEVIDNKFWILTVNETDMYAHQTFKGAIEHIFEPVHGFEMFVIEGGRLIEFKFEENQFILTPVPLADMVKEWYRITGRELAEKVEYTQRPA